MAYSAKTDWKINDTVQPQDMNRIEKGIKDLDTGKVDTNLSNVPNSTFSSKAKASGIDIPSSANITYYVSPSGDDTTGTGSADHPFKTLQKAVDTFPDSNPAGVIYDIQAATGTYAGFTLRANKRIRISADDNITVGSVVVNAGVVWFVDEFTVNGSLWVNDRGLLKIAKATILAQNTEHFAINCHDGGMFVAGEEITIKNYTHGVLCFLSQVFISNIIMTTGSVGVSCESGMVHIGQESILTTTKYVVNGSGRIFVGSETIIQQ